MGYSFASKSARRYQLASPEPLVPQFRKGYARTDLLNCRLKYFFMESRLQMSLENTPVKVFWTGGWDSTFQLLRLVLMDSRQVSPVYMLDPSRRSTGLDIWAMERIRSRLEKDYPAAFPLLGRTRYAVRNHFPLDDEIAGAIQQIRKSVFIGRQYAWLAQFCKNRRLKGVHLCLHAMAHKNPDHFDFEQLVSEGGDQFEPVLDANQKTTSIGKIFGYFSFPLLKMTKSQMNDIVVEHGWTEIMGLTWFCRKPMDDGKPCGNCLCCRQTRDEGLGFRVPRI